MEKQSMLKQVKNFFRVIKKSYPKIQYLLVTGSLIKAALPFVTLFFSARILNAFLRQDFKYGVLQVIIMLSIQFIGGLIGKACDERVEVIQINADDMVKSQIATKIYEIEYERLEEHQTMEQLRNADLMTRGLGGVGYQILDCYHIMEAAFSILGSLIFTALLFTQIKGRNGNFFCSNWSTLILIGIYGFVIFLFIKNNKKIAKVFEEQSKGNDKVNALAGYLINMMLEQKNAKDFRIYQMQDSLSKRLSVLEGEGTSMYLDTAKKTGLLSARNDFLSQLCAGAGYFIIGAKAMYGAISIGNVLLYVGALNQIITAILTLTQIGNQFIYRAQCLQAYTDFLQMPNMSYDGTLPIEKRADGNYLFEFHDVSFSYPDTEKEIISHLNLQFKPNEKLAIVGKNGAGKTTLIKLLCRLYEPTSGSITLNGIDIRKYDYEEYVQAFSVVFQDFQLFSLGLGDNVAAGEKWKEEDVWSSLDQVQMKKRVEKMPDRLKTRLYNNNGSGVDLSGGEAQKCAIARALYKDAPFVILDEPTAALDPIAEAEIYENFNQMIENKTAVYISHRMSSCQFCDRIIVLDKGKISEEGTHEILVNKQGIYAQLYQMQAQYYAS